MSWTNWYLPIGCPNVSRSRAYSTERSRQARMTPTAPAATVKRPWSSAYIAISKPCPSSPIEVLGRHLDVLEEELAGRAGPDAELVLGLARRHAGPLALDDERGDALVLRRRVGLGEDELVVGDGRVRDPVLLAVEDVGVALAARGRAHRGDVGARAGLGQAEARELLAARLRDEVALLLLLARVAQERQRVQADVDGDQRPERRLAALDLLADERLGDEVEAGAAVLLRDRRCRGCRARPCPRSAPCRGGGRCRSRSRPAGRARPRRRGPSPGAAAARR